MVDILSINNLSLSFSQEDIHTQTLDGVSFTVQSGEIVGIIGESGSGKSITARSITGLLPANARIHPDAAIHFDGHDMLSLKDRDRRNILGKDIGMIFQDPLSSLNPTMTVGQQIVEVLRLHKGLSKKEAKQATIHLMESIGIRDSHDRYNRYPHEFSGGMRQRIMIAIALAASPKLLIADEPTTALDVTIQAQILGLIKQLQQELNLSVLLITHDFSVVAQLCSRVIVMQDGKVVETGAIEDIFQHPQHPYTRLLLEAVPRIDQEKLITKPTVTDPLIQVQGLTQEFELSKGSFFKAVDNVDLTIYRGETLGLVGESGSGKSTLGRAILNLYQASAGRVLFEGFPLNTLSKQEMLKVRKDMQIIFQDPYASLNPRMKIGDILATALDTHKLATDNKARKARIRELLELVELPADFAHRYPHEFSGGQRQRIGIARALAVEPKFIVADEPLSALDVSIQAQIIDLLERLQGQLNLTYLFIAHDLAVVKQISDRVAVMKQGQIVELAPTNDLYNHPLHPYTRDLLKAAGGLGEITIDHASIPSNIGTGLTEVEEGHFLRLQ